MISWCPVYRPPLIHTPALYVHMYEASSRTHTYIHTHTELRLRPPTPQAVSSVLYLTLLLQDVTVIGSHTVSHTKTTRLGVL